MGKKRKSEAKRRLDEVDRTLYASFCGAANSLSHLYSQSMTHNRLSFHAGERHSLEKLYQWIWRQEEEGSRATTGDILNYIQNELDYNVEEPSMSPRTPHQNQNSQPLQLSNPGFLVSSGATAVARSEHCDQQSKNPVFSNALSSPVRRSLQNYHIDQGGTSSGNGTRSNDPGFPQHQNGDSHPLGSNDSSMDI